MNSGDLSYHMVTDQSTSDLLKVSITPVQYDLNELTFTRDNGGEDLHITKFYLHDEDLKNLSSTIISYIDAFVDDHSEVFL